MLRIVTGFSNGRHKPLYMMEGLDGSFDGICFVSYHGSIGSEHAVLSHTYNPRAIWEVRINGTVVGESGLNALVAAHYKVPIIFVSGDDVVAEEARPVAPEAKMVVVKHSLSRYSAANLHPEVACELLQSGAEEAVRILAKVKEDAKIKEDAHPWPYAPALFEDGKEAEVEVTFLTADMAEMALWIRGVERSASRTVKFSGTNLLDLFRTFVTVVMLTRSVVDPKYI